MANRPYLHAKDILSGQDGRIIIEWNGRTYDAIWVKKITAKLEKEKEEIKTIGARLTQSKTVGAKGSGTLGYFKVISVFIEMAELFEQTGEDSYFNMTVITTDPSGKLGSEKILFEGCNLDEFTLTNIDVESSVLEEETEFTFTSFKILDKFNE